MESTRERLLRRMTNADLEDYTRQFLDFVNTGGGHIAGNDPLSEAMRGQARAIRKELFRSPRGRGEED